MTNATLSMLDQDELLQLSLNASAAADSATAIAMLKEAVSRPDARGVAHYLLGAQYAQIGMYPRAADEMEAAIALEPGLSIARLQLGLLWLTGGHADKALTVLAPLTELPEKDALRCFGAGLSYVARNDGPAAIIELREGIALNTQNAPLNVDMQQMIDEINAHAADTPRETEAEQPLAAEDGRHVLLSAYTGRTSH